MGLYTSIYLGPAFICIPYEKEKIHDAKTCPLEGCPNKNRCIKSKHCIECGSEIVWAKISFKEKYPNRWDISEKLQEKLIMISNFNAFHCWIPNVKVDFGMDIKSNESNCLIIDGNLRERNLVDFCRFFEKEFEILEKEYKNKVRVEWVHTVDVS